MDHLKGQQTTNQLIYITPKTMENLSVTSMGVKHDLSTYFSKHVYGLIL